MKNLVVVESPAKAKTIKSFLGKDYEVVASKGHIRDLPKNSFGIKIENSEFIPEYKIEKDHTEVVKELKRLTKECSTVYIATDEDREGEAIGFHIAEAIGKDPTKLPRIVFHEITKKAILHSLENPRNIDIDKVNAQQTRRLLDRIVGYKLSPLLSSKIQRGLSAGRVQSSALKIAVDREKEIKAFIPEEYHTISAIFNKEIDSILVEYENKKIDKMDIKTTTQATEIIENIKNLEYMVESIENKNRKTSTPEPFMTSTLQQSASSQLGFSPKRTMQIAQKLYEGVSTDQGIMGVITYMRTDSLNLAAEAVDSAREFIEKSFGKKYLPKSAKNYSTKSKSAQEAHEAIRPTRVDFTPQIASRYIKDEELKLYTMIYNRFIASQMEDAIFELQNIIFSSTKAKFKANGKKLVFDGFYKLLGSDDKDKLLPHVELNSVAKMSDIADTKSFTEPPSRYSEASLIKKLESLGIGRPSTYAPTISILQTRRYIETEKKQIVPTEIAFKVIELLEEHFNEIVNSDFTAKMEEELDDISENKKDWQNVLREFYEPFMKKIESGKSSIKSQKVVVPTGEFCPKCGLELVKRAGRFGEFIACSGYPKCKYTKPTEGGEVLKTETIKSDVKCDKCGADMVIKSGKRGEFLACSNYPECKNTKPLKEPKTLDVKCPECGGDILLRSSKRGAFYGCSNYPKCNFISKFEPVSEPKCPECNYMMAKKTYRDKNVFECIKCKTRVDSHEPND